MVDFGGLQDQPPRDLQILSPDCFDDLISIIKDEDVFLNNSNNEQMSVEHQVAISLYRFGHYGNAVSTVKVALWAGYCYGTV